MGPTWRIDGGMTGAGTDPFDLSKALEGAAKAHLGWSWQALACGGTG